VRVVEGDHLSGVLNDVLLQHAVQQQVIHG
jgi:hypothetical protein